MEKEDFIVYYMPYLGIDDKFQVDDFIFWNYQKYKSEYLKDENAIKYFDTFFEHHIDYKREPVEITIISFKDPMKFRELDEKVLNKLWKIINAIAFDHIRNQNDLDHYSAENFFLRSQKYKKIVVIS